MGALEEALAHRVERITGFSLTEEQLKHRLVAVVAERANAVGAASPKAYLELLESEPDSGEEWSQVIAILTNGQTSFFRDPQQFAALTQILNALGQQRQPIQVWSAGCSTGEEPYSVAALCLELGLSCRILATDINPRFLERAADGHYAAWALRNVDPERRARWFEEVAGSFRVSGEVRSLVELRRHNLVLDQPPRARGPQGLWQVILCRNVFLYFRRDRIAEACRRIASVLDPGGRFLVSASETLRGIEAPLLPEVLDGRVFYRRVVGAAADAGDAGRRRLPTRSIRQPTTGSGSRSRPAAPTPLAGARTLAARRPARIATAPPVRPTGREPGASPAIAAALLARSGRIEDALDLVCHAGPGEGNTILVHLTRGHLHLRLHEIGAAVSAYQAVVDLDPLLCEAYYFEGIAHRKGGDWSTAVDVLRRALFLAPGFWQAAYLLAGAYDRLGRVHDAARERTRARRLLRDRAPGVAFLSHPVFVDWLSVREDQARRLLKIAS